jgi:hypothetical protein
VQIVGGDGGWREGDTGRVVFELLSRVIEECVRAVKGGGGAILWALESIPIAESEGDEMSFGGAVLSSVCKYLVIGTTEGKLGVEAELTRNLEVFTELVAELGACGSYALSYDHLLELIVTVASELLRTDMDPDERARRAARLHRCANNVLKPKSKFKLGCAVAQRSVHRPLQRMPRINILTCNHNCFVNHAKPQSQVEGQSGLSSHRAISLIPRPNVLRPSDPRIVSSFKC